MPEPNRREFALSLESAGLERDWARRLADELCDHYEDLCGELVARGTDRRRAEKIAVAELGMLEDISGVALAQRQLLGFRGRYPTLAATAVAAADGAGVLARWGLIVASSGVITAGTLLAMQIAITLS